MKFPTNRMLILDIETSTSDVETAELKFFGAYSYLSNKRYFLDTTHIDYIKEMVANHDVIITFNGKRFDIPILNKYDIYFTGKVQVDLWEVLSEPKLDPKTRVRTGGKGRGAFMGLNLHSWSLANIMKAFNLGDYKKDFDYSVLKKSNFTNDELKYIQEYLDQDITITKQLFEHVNNFFYPFTEFLDEKNVQRMTYITASIASLSYKIICHEAGLAEEYGEGESKPYEGGYVRDPLKEEYVGDVICFDFASLYPSIYRGFNLASPITPDYQGKVFEGNDFFKIKGRYKKDEQGKIEQVLARLFALRKIYKSNGDSKEYLIKIIINAFYGTTPKPTFLNVYSEHGAEDCTFIGQTMIKYVAEEFNKHGFEVLYGDTDSVYVALKDKTKEEAVKLSQEINAFLKSKMPFPHDDFGLAVDVEIKAIFFFKADEKTYKKKNYIFIYKDKKANELKLKIKGLPIIKSNASKVATLIYNNHLKKMILEQLKIKFPLGWLKQLIYYELEKDLTLATTTYKFRESSYYDSNPNTLHAQIAKKYPTSPVDLIPLSSKKTFPETFGVGKDKKYCTIEEFHERKLTVQDIDLSSTFNNLEPFVKNEQMNLGEF